MWGREGRPHGSSAGPCHSASSLVTDSPSAAGRVGSRELSSGPCVRRIQRNPGSGKAVSDPASSVGHRPPQMRQTSEHSAPPATSAPPTGTGLGPDVLPGWLSSWSRDTLQGHVSDQTDTREVTAASGGGRTETVQTPVPSGVCIRVTGSVHGACLPLLGFLSS